MVDYVRDLIGLHVNGVAEIVEDRDSSHDPELGRRADRWVVVHVDEAYIHCRKHIPRMARITEKREWGTDDPGTQPTMPRSRRRFPSTTHLGAGASRILRS